MSIYSTFNQAGSSIIAGKTLKNINESASYCIKPIQQQKELTPEHIKKYRKSYKIEPGKVILHYGIASDNRPIDQVHGAKSKESDHVNQIFTDPNGKGINQLVNDIKEQKYASRKNEPYAQSISRNYILPQSCTDNNFQFGQSTIQNEFTGKEVVFPPDQQIKETQADRQRYIKSHQQYDPGEQKDRQYQWPDQVSQNHRFGKKQVQVPNQVQQILMPDDTQNIFPQTILVQKNLEDYRNYKDEPLGKCKNLGQINQYVQDNQTYGFKPSQQQDEWSAQQCIKGQATIQESISDDNLGKATRFGYRNQTKNGEIERIFGVPTIRNDVQKRNFKSLADPNNYGDEPIVVQLLFPDQYSTLGLSHEDFNQLRTKNEIKDIFNAIGISYISGKFETIYKRAQEFQQSLDNVSCQAFLQAVNEMHDLD